MKVGILGYGVEGRSAHKYWGARGHDLTICDRNENLELEDELPGAALKVGSGYLEGLEEFDLLVRTPSLRPDLLPSGVPTTSVVREFFAQCEAPIIGVTGTKGKGTTSSLITAILKAAGKRVHLAGNIGVPALELLPDVQEGDIVVLELSSFQLMDLERSPQVAVGLMMAPDHLDWHSDMDEYVAAKRKLFAHQRPEDLAVYHPTNQYTLRLVQDTPARKVPYTQRPGAYIRDGEIIMDGTPICRTDEVGLVGPHNLENICAAVTATWELTGGEAEAAARALREFTGLPHRLEPVAEVDGVRYFDDSFATTPETAIAAIRSFEGPKLIILGGSDKGARYDELAREVEDGGVIHALLIGDTAPAIAEALGRVGFTHYTLVDWKGMDVLVQTCRQLTEPGDVVLLSTGCASFGLFKNYKDRGDQFQAAVRALMARQAS